MAREPYGFDQQSGFLRAVGQDPVLSQVKLIAEPWDCGPGGYQVGGFAPGWAEWNDRFRDTVRAYWKGDDGKLPEMATRVTASGDKFNWGGRRPWSSVNFITAHDGFTLNDVVSYNDKHNEPNGEEGRDGSDNNHSWNCGAEGPTDDPEIKALRERQKRNMLATLFLSQGLPMLLAGDEFGRTQGGNNNAYCQDNEISWVDWNITDEGKSLQAFVAKLARMRRTFPILRRERFLTGAWNEELQIKDITWITPDDTEMTGENWENGNSRVLAVILDGRAQPTGIRKRGSDRTLLLVMNPYHDSVEFTLPTMNGGSGWTALIDTNSPDMDEETVHKLGDKYTVTGRSLLLCELEPEGAKKSADANRR